VVKRIKPNPGIAARIRTIAMINAQVHMGSFGSDGIFKTRPLLKIEVKVEVDI
jgi:hypothetical protein